MSRPLWTLRSFIWPPIFLLALQGGIFLELLFSPDPLRVWLVSLFVSVTALMAAFVVLCGWRHPWLWRFSRQVRRFLTAENTRIVLHYEPELEGGETISALLQSCQLELDDLTRWFGFPLRGRVTVYLFARWQNIRAIFGPNYRGTAIFRANAIIIARDNYVPVLMRHELVHLFAARWNIFAPPLLSEGLAVYLQGVIWEQPIGAAVLPLLRQGVPKLPSLLRSKYFFAEPQRRSCYTLAGSFTGFLIRRFGWDRYRRLYRRCDGFRFRAKFRKCIGVSLEEAEWQWRNEVMPILNRKIGRKPHC